MRDRLKQGEQGQIVALLAVALLSLLAISALILNVGYSWYAKRQAQAQVDAAALAAAQELPDTAKATQLFNDYLAKNPLPGGVTTSGSTPPPGCTTNPCIKFTHLVNSRLGAPVNKVQVLESGTIPSVLGQFVGLSSFNYSVNSNACEPCGNKKFDIMVVLDRSSSMCDTGPGCFDLDNAKKGLHELFQTMDAKLDSIGLVSFPPVINSTNVCATPGGYDDPRTLYQTDPLRQDFQNSDGTPATSSSLYLHTVVGGSCIPDGGGTSYVDALRTGVDALSHHRAGAQPVLIFMTDGSANTGPVYKCSQSFPSVPGCVDRPPGNADNTQPCHSAMAVAQAAKAAGVIIYTIGYGLYTSGKESYCWSGVWKNGSHFQLTPTDNNNWTSNHAQGVNCYDAVPQQMNCLESPQITPQEALQAIASPGTGKYFDTVAGDVTPVFQAIASDIENGTSHLVDDGA